MKDMKRKITAVLMVALVCLTIGVSAQNQVKEKRVERMREFAERRDNPGERRMDFFTEEQKEAMKTIRLETEKQLKPLKNELRELNAHQQTLVTADKADMKAIEKNIDKISGVKAQMAKIMAKQHQEVRAQLNEEQLMKFDSMREKRMQKGRENMDRRERPGRGQGLPGKGA